MPLKMCHLCLDSKSKLDFCANCHKWLCDDDMYKTVCALDKDGTHFPVSAVKLTPFEPEPELISQLIH